MGIGTQSFSLAERERFSVGRDCGDYELRECRGGAFHTVEREREGEVAKCIRFRVRIIFFSPLLFIPLGWRRQTSHIWLCDLVCNFQRDCIIIAWWIHSLFQRLTDVVQVRLRRLGLFVRPGCAGHLAGLILAHTLWNTNRHGYHFSFRVTALILSVSLNKSRYILYSMYVYMYYVVMKTRQRMLHKHTVESS